jgi:glycosyltransferase involved in cell wall biosynthesis
VDEPIRVLRVIARLNVGGPSLHVAYLSAGLAERGYETKLVAGRVSEGEGSMEYMVRELGVEPVFIRQLHREISAASDLAAVSVLRKMIRDFRPHVLHTHTAKAGAVGRVAATLAGDARPPAVVHTFHGHVLRGYFNETVTSGFTVIEKRLARTTDALIAVSPEVRDDLVALGIAPAERIHVIRLGLDLDVRIATPLDAAERERAALGVPNDRLLVGWLGRMTEIKRVDVLLDAFARLRRDGVDADLVLVGDGPLRRGLEQQAEAAGIADRTHFVGYRADVGSIYAAIDVVALSSANEGTPVAVIEAQAAGVPAVSTDVGGVADVVRHGVGGFLVPANDATAMAARLAELAADADLRSRLGTAGAEWVRDRYSVPRLVGEMDALYRSLLASPRRTPGRSQALTPRIEPTLPPATRASIPTASRRLRILLLSQYFSPEIGATQLRMQSFAEYLTARGHKVTVIAEFPNHPFGVIGEEYRGRVVEDDRSNDYRVLRVWVKTNPVKNQSTRLAFYASYTALAAAVGPRAGRADVVLATSPPLFTGVAGAALAAFNRAPLVLDVRDLWPAAAQALSQISGGWMDRGALALERWLYRRAAAVVAVTQPFCDHIDGIRRKPPATAVVANGTLELFFDAVADSSARRELGAQNGEFVVTFAGNHGIAQALPSVLEAAGAAGDEILFSFVGDGPVKADLQDLATRRNLTNVRFHPQVPLTSMPRLLAASDALLVPLSAHPTFEQFVPSKMIDFMAVGRPVLLSAAGEPARLLERAGGGIAVSPEDPLALAGAARWLADHPEERTAMADRGRMFAAKHLRTAQAERLEQVLLHVAGAER